MKKIYIILVFLFAFALQMQAQQDPQYTQYMYNMNVVNPAYAGSYDGVGIGLLYRSQWVGLEGSPKTGTFNISSPIGRQVGMGLSFISDEIGPVDRKSTRLNSSH